MRGGCSAALMVFNPVCKERTSRYLPKTMSDGQRREDGPTQATKQNDLTRPEKKTKRENRGYMSGSRHTAEKRGGQRAGVVFSCLLHCSIYVDYEDYRLIVIFFCVFDLEGMVLSEKACYYFCFFSCLIQEKEFN